MFQDVKACMAFPKRSETRFSRDVDFGERLQGVSLVCLVYHSFHRFIWFCLVHFAFVEIHFGNAFKA